MRKLILKMDRETRQLLSAVFLGISAGCFSASLICVKTLRQVKEINEKTQRKNMLILDTFKKMEDIITDVTLSGSDKEKKIEELETFLEIILELDPK